jgi:AhpD family alkylhydroperoxidase
MDTAACAWRRNGFEGTAMQRRFDPWAGFPAGYEAMLKVSAAVKQSGLDPALIELAQIRASQINGCAFCLSMHIPAARKAGVAQRKLDFLAAWRDVPDFDARERAALEWSETLTRIADRGVPDEVYARLRAAFDEKEIGALTFAVMTINGWNRLMVAAAAPPVTP